MIVESKEIIIKTKNNFEIVDITNDVGSFVKNSGIIAGTITITTKHTTTAIRVNENEPLLLKDIKNHIDSLTQIDNYHHDKIEERTDCPANEPKNAHSHLKALLLGASETMPIINSKLSLGTWQHILFIELDGPRERTYTLVIMGK